MRDSYDMIRVYMSDLIYSTLYQYGTHENANLFPQNFEKLLVKNNVNV